MNTFINIRKIDFPDDDFIIESKKILELKKAKTTGSYIKYGKDKACDLDLTENLNIDKTELNTILDEYFKKLKLYENKFILNRLSFNIIDESIQKLLNNLGNLTGLLQIENENININQIDESLPTDMKKKIIKLITEYKNEPNIYTFINLYMYLKSNLIPTFTIDEAIKGEKIFNGKKIKLSQDDFSYMYIEVIYNNFRISNFIYFKPENKPKDSVFYVELNEALIKKIEQNDNICEYQMSYYKMIKYFIVFIKKAYYDKILDQTIASKTIDLYNEMYNYRERIGSMNNELCRIENEIIQNKNNTKIKNEYNDLKIQFEQKCKTYFLEKSKPYLKYLKTNFKFI